MPQTVLAGVEEVSAAVGQHLGYSDWLEITQDRVNLFADANGDHQWIHVDPERADGPFGGAIAHGYLTVSLSNFLPQIVDVQGISAGINYGVDKIRFPSPVPVGARVRGGADWSPVTDVKGGIQTTMVITIEIEGQERPACIIDSISRYLRQ